MLHLILQACAAVAAVVTGEMDAAISEEGFAKKYQEANEVITWISRSKTPSKFWLRLYNLSLTGMIFASAFLLPGWVGVPELFWGSFMFQVADALKHVRSVTVWKKAFATNGESLFASQTAWQKFLW